MRKKTLFVFVLKIILYICNPKGKKKYNFINIKLKEMTKADLINEISKKTGLDKVVVSMTLESFMDEVKKAMIAKEDVFLRGFGSFVVKTRKKKTARNILKNTAIDVPEHDIATFKPAKVFAEAMK